MTLQSQNHYQIFDLPVAFDVDGRALAERYRQLQQVVHPDKYANAGAQQQRLAVQHAAQINDAFQVLKDPLLRAKYLLHLKGVDVDATNGDPLEPAFLMEQMELRERLGAVRETPAPVAELAVIAAQVAARRETLLSNLHDCFRASDVVDWRPAVVGVKKLQFMYRLQDEIDRLEDELV